MRSVSQIKGQLDGMFLGTRVPSRDEKLKLIEIELLLDSREFLTEIRDMLAEGIGQAALTLTDAVTAENVVSP